MHGRGGGLKYRGGGADLSDLHLFENPGSATLTIFLFEESYLRVNWGYSLSSAIMGFLWFWARLSGLGENAS